MPTVSEDLPDGEVPVLVQPPGIYVVKFSHWETRLVFGKVPKLVLWFRIVDTGDYFQELLPRYYNVERIIGKAAKWGQFKAAFHSDFNREFTLLFQVRAKRLDRYPMSQFEDRPFVRAKVKTVTRTSKQEAIDPLAQYSVIEKLIGLKTSSDL